MKKMMTLVALTIFATGAFAQSLSKDDIAIIQASFGKDKAELVKQYMAVPAGKDTSFWRVYDKYEDARRAIGRKKIALIDEYAKSYTSLDDKKAADLLKKKMDMADEFTKLQRKYYPEIAKVIGGVQAAKFFQLEDYLNNIINLGIQNNIPFIDELDKTKVQEMKQ